MCYIHINDAEKLLLEIDAIFEPDKGKKLCLELQALGYGNNTKAILPNLKSNKNNMINIDAMILAVATNLLSKEGKTTTLQIKNACRVRYGKGINFNQAAVSAAMIADEAKSDTDPTKRILDLTSNTILTNKKKHQEYVLGATVIGVTPSTSVASEELFTVKYTDEDGCAATATGSKRAMESKIKRGLPFYWSNSKEEFIHLEDAHALHLKNIIVKDLANAHGNQQAVNDLILSPKMQAFVARYDEIVEELTVSA